MKKVNIKTLAMFAIAASLSLTSCDKDDDDDEEPAPTRSELLVSQQWSLIAFNVEPALDWDQDGTQENNLIPYVGACTLDDFWLFQANGNYTSEEGASKCNPNDPQIIESGQWLWNSDQTRLILNANSQTFEATVTSITASQLIWEYVIVNNGVTYTFTQTLN